MNSFTLHRARDRAPRSRARSRSGSRAARSSRRRTTSTPRPATLTPRRVEGGGGRLPLLPRAGPRAGRAARRARRAAAGGAARAAGARGSGGIEAELDHDRALVLVTGGLDGLWEATVAAGADRRRGRERHREQRSSAPASTRRRSNAARAREARRGARADPARRPSTRRSSKLGEPGFSAEPYLAQEAVSDTAELEPIVDADPRREPRPGRGVPGRQGGAARLLRRPGDEGDEGPGEPAGRQRARAREARPPSYLTRADAADAVDHDRRRQPGGGSSIGGKRRHPARDRCAARCCSEQPRRRTSSIAARPWTTR